MKFPTVSSFRSETIAAALPYTRRSECLKTGIAGFAILICVLRGPCKWISGPNKVQPKLPRGEHPPMRILQGVAHPPPVDEFDVGLVGTIMSISASKNGNSIESCIV